MKNRTCSRLIQDISPNICFILQVLFNLHCDSYLVCVFLFSLPVESVPAELRDPFYCDQYEQEHLKPPVTRLLQSSELYCRTYGLLLGGGGGGEAQPKDNGALLQLLAERGVVPKDQGKAATDADLRHKPIKMVTLAKLLRSGL